MVAPAGSLAGDRGPGSPRATKSFPRISRSALADTGRWLDPSTAWNQLAGGTMTATTWAQVATTAAAWIALPALAGGWHVLHRPVDA